VESNPSAVSRNCTAFCLTSTHAHPEPPEPSPHQPPPTNHRAGNPHVALTQLTCSWRFTAFERLRALISSVYARDGLALTAPAARHARQDAAGSTEGSSSKQAAAAVVVTPLIDPTASPLGCKAAAAVAAAAQQVMPALMGGRGGLSGLSAAAAAAAAQAPLFGGVRGMGTAVVGAMNLELLAEDESTTTATSAADGDGRHGGSGLDQVCGSSSDCEGEEGGAADSPGCGVDDDDDGDVWHRVWSQGSGLVLVVHEECASSKHNAVEVEVVRRIVQVRARCADRSWRVPFFEVLLGCCGRLPLQSSLPRSTLHPPQPQANPPNPHLPSPPHPPRPPHLRSAQRSATWQS